MASTLCDIYNKSLEQGLFPHAFKPAIIKPVHKSGPITKIENDKRLFLIDTDINKSAI